MSEVKSSSSKPASSSKPSSTSSSKPKAVTKTRDAHRARPTDRVTRSQDARKAGRDEKADPQHLSELVKNYSTPPGLSGDSRGTRTSDDVGKVQETSGPWTDHGNGVRSRTVTDPDGKGDWQEVDRNGSLDRSRSYEENGTRWKESRQEGNHWRYRNGGMEGLAKEAEGKPSASFPVEGIKGEIQKIKVSGNPSPQELERVKRAIEAMPPEARKHASDIILSENLGQVFNGNGRPPSGVGAMAGDPNHPGRMVLDRNSLISDQAAQSLIHHEAGHNLDAASGHPSNSALWKALPGSVTPYGARSGAEDFAETHGHVMRNWDSYKNMGYLTMSDTARKPVPANPFGVERTPSASKVQEIMRLYGVEPPGYAR